MAKPEIHKWEEVADDFKDTLVLGNGASIAIHNGFEYGSLLEKAQDHLVISDRISRTTLLAEESDAEHSKGEESIATAVASDGADAADSTRDVRPLFEHFKTNDFELVLRNLWTAREVNEILDVEEQQTLSSYRRVRNALIRTVRDVHCSYDHAEPYLKDIYKFMGRFDTVHSLSYDLIVYWAMMKGIEDVNNGLRFQDCFRRSQVTANLIFKRELLRNRDFTKKSTWIFYPHGNLALIGRDEYGQESRHERKIEKVQGKPLLIRIFEEWIDNEGEVPVFVSEGTPEKKRSRIGRSTYLNTVYDRVVAQPEKSLVIYGWNVKDVDQHLVDQLFSTRVRRVAISVHLPQFKKPAELKAHCDKTENNIKTTAASFDCEPEVCFFDAQSDNCWPQQRTSH